MNTPAAKTAHEQTALQRQIDATDRQIDRRTSDTEVGRYGWGATA